MKSPTKHVQLLLFVFLLLLNLCLASGSNAGKGCLFADAAPSDIFQSRKMLHVLEGKEGVFKMDVMGRENGLVEKNLDKWEELRRVPAGPDPLHHNGSGPKKPRNSP